MASSLTGCLTLSFDRKRDTPLGSQHPDQAPTGSLSIRTPPRPTPAAAPRPDSSWDRREEPSGSANRYPGPYAASVVSAEVLLSGSPQGGASRSTVHEDEWLEASSADSARRTSGSAALRGDRPVSAATRGRRPRDRDTRGARLIRRAWRHGRAHSAADRVRSVGNLWTLGAPES